MLLSLVRRGRRGPALAAIAAALAALGAGCGGDDETDVARGKRLFTGEGRCGGCHVLARAGTRGTVGPNLDDALVQARRDGLGQSTLEDVVYDQILYPRKNSKMPAKLVTGDDARDVAAYVAQAAGRLGEDQGGVREPPASRRRLIAGRAIFIESGCGGCHILSDARTSAAVGPQLNGLRGAAARGGGSPKEYIRRAIVNPDERVVGGFPAGVMPQDYRRKLTRRELDVLVDYLLRVSR